ncbi:MAG: hypothetical protein GF329_11005 [Candidatus Lokiarchaeota archaeon]|nr:hypothetical protein [Candidatus Lokiarchaeota archaeon]
MKKFVFDACSLICLTKINVKEKLPMLGKLIVSKSVKGEATADLEKFQEAKIIKTNIENNILKERDYNIKKIFSITNLGKGEKEVIEICSKSDSIPVTDDQKAFNFALNIGLTPKTSEIILLDLLTEDLISYIDFKTLFSKLAKIKLLKHDIIAFFKERAKKIIENKEKEENEN